MIANTSKPGSIGSVSWPFQATVQNNAGVPIAIMSLQNGDLDAAAQPFNLNQITDAAFSRDGKLLIASQNSLQLCKIVQDKLVVVKNFTDAGVTASVATEPYPVYGVTDIAVDLLDDMVCTTASTTGPWWSMRTTALPRIWSRRATSRPTPPLTPSSNGQS